MLRAHPHSSYLNWMVEFQTWPHFQLKFPSKTWFFLMIYLNFQWQKSIKIQHLPILSPNIFLSYSSRSFQQHPKESYFLWSFELWFNLTLMKKSFNIQKLLCCKSKHHETKANAPLLVKSFPKIRKFNMKHPGLGDLSMTKQVKLACVIARLYV
jgi:hypothetical protein